MLPVTVIDNSTSTMSASPHALVLRLSKVIAHLPPTVLGSKHKRSLEEIDVGVKEHESMLKHIAINGTLPDQSRAIGVNELKNVIKSFQVLVDDLKKALGMAAPLLKKVEKQETSGLSSQELQEPHASRC